MLTNRHLSCRQRSSRRSDELQEACPRLGSNQRIRRLEKKHHQRVVGPGPLGSAALSGGLGTVKNVIARSAKGLPGIEWRQQVRKAPSPDKHLGESHVPEAAMDNRRPAVLYTEAGHACAPADLVQNLVDTRIAFED